MKPKEFVIVSKPNKLQHGPLSLLAVQLTLQSTLYIVFFGLVKLMFTTQKHRNVSAHNKTQPNICTSKPYL